MSVLSDDFNPHARILAAIATRLLVTDRAGQVAREVFRELAAHLQLDVCFNYLVSDDGATLRLDSWAGVPPEVADGVRSLEFGQGVCGTVAAERHHIVVENVQASSDAIVSFIQPSGIRAYACYPLVARRGLVGTLSFGTVARDRFDAQELALIEAVSNMAAIAIERSRMLRAFEAERGARDALILELQAERARWQTLVEGIAEEVWACDAEGRMSLVNLASVTAMRLDAFKGKSVHEILEEVEILDADGRPRPPERAPLLRSLAGEVVRGEEIMRHRRTGVTRWRQFSSAPLRDAAGSITGAVAIVTDITERKRVEEALRDSEERLRDADRKKDEFIATLSHELRNPLAAIQYALPLVKQSGLGDPATRALGVISRQSDHLARLVDDLLDVSRIARGKIELRRERVTVQSLVHSAADTVSQLIAAARHHVEVIVPTAPLWVDADPNRLTQVLTNLLTNAAKFTPRGGRIELEATSDRGEALVRVRDNGVGIPEGSLASVFEMFWQSDRPGQTVAAGLGVGLGLSKRLVEMHGGSIEARSEGAGRGAEFVIRLPLFEPPSQPHADDDRPRSTATTSPS